MNPQVLHKLLMLYLFPPLMITLHLVLQLLHSVSLIPVLGELLPAEIAPVEELLLEQPHRFIIIFNIL